MRAYMCLVSVTDGSTNGKLESIENGQIYDAVDFEKAIELAGKYVFQYLRCLEV